jgi:PAS domain S-box-containing protein
MEMDLQELSKEELISKFYEQDELIKSLNSKMESLNKEYSIYKELFENSPTPMWEEDITELISHLKSLQSSGISNFEEYYNNNPGELSNCIAKIKIVNVNQATVNLHAADSKEQLIKDLEYLFTDTSKEAFKNEIIAIANGVLSYESETCARTFNNQLVDLKLYLQIIERFEDNQIKYFAIVSSIDITKQKEAEDNLTKSELAFRTILDTSDDVALLVDVNGFILESNKACQKLYGVNRIDLIGRKLEHFASSKIIDERMNIFRNTIKSKESSIYEDEAYGKQWISKISPLLDDKNNVEKLVIFHRDVTSKYLAEKKIKENELKYRTIFNNIQISITHVDTSGIITDINDFHLDRIAKGKKDKSEFLGTNILERKSIIKAKIVDHYKNLLNGKSFELLEVYFPRTTGGESFYFNIHGIPTYSNTKLTGAIITTEDVTKDVFNRKIIEETHENLKKTKEQLQFAIDGSGVGAWDWNIITGEQEFSDRWANMLGYTLNELEPTTMKTWVDLTHPEDFLIAQKILHDHFEKKIPTYKIEMRLKHKSGQWIWVIDRGKVVEWDDSGNPLRMVGTHFDITERKQTEIALKESKAKLSTLMDNLPGMAYQCRNDVHWTMLFVNNSCKKLTGYEPNQIINNKGKSYYDLIHADDRVFVKKKVEEALRIGEHFELEYRIISADGKEKWVWERGVQSISQVHGQELIEGVIHDITDRKKAEERNRYLAIMLDSSPLAYIVTDLVGRVTDVNPALEKMTGYTKEELLGQNPIILNAEKNAEDVQKSIFEALQKEEVWTGEILDRKKNGDLHYVKSSIFPMYDEEENVISYVGFQEDISERRNTQNALKESEGFLKETQTIGKLGSYTLDIPSGKWVSSEILDNIFGIDSNFDKSFDGWTKILHPEWQSIMIDYFNQEVVEDKNKFDKEYQIIRQNDKAELWVHGIGELKYNDDNQPITMVGTIRDITESKFAEAKLKESEDKLRNLSRYLNNVREEDRKKIARAVHDDLGQKLTAINLDVSWIKQNIPAEFVELKEMFEPVLEMVNQSIITVQKISTELRPGILDDLGLLNAIQWQSNEISRRSNLVFTLNLYEDEIALPDKVKTALFRVYQEALTNIVRHSKANNVSVNLGIQERNIIFEISDDGIGISKSNINDFTSFGIIGMRERVASINGIIEITNLANTGTKIKMTVPFWGGI